MPLIIINQLSLGLEGATVSSVCCGWAVEEVRVRRKGVLRRRGEGHLNWRQGQTCSWTFWAKASPKMFMHRHAHMHAPPCTHTHTLRHTHAHM